MPERATYIVDLFEQHVDELGFLFAQWRRALRDPDYTIAAVNHLEERLRGHLQGVQVPGEKAWPRLLELLAEDDADLNFAAAYALLHVEHSDLNAAVLEAFAAAQGERFDALAAALSYGPMRPDALAHVRAQLGAVPAQRAVAVAEVLTFHGVLELTGEQLRYFIEHEAADVRRGAWRIAALQGTALPPQAYAAALRDEDPSVASGALEAGAWAGVPGVLPALRHFLTPATSERFDALVLLAVLGTSEDLPRVQHALDDGALGPRRCALAASYGSPLLVPHLIDAMSDPEPAVAASAGSAFQRLTDVDVASDERATLPPEDGQPADEVEAEFQDEVFLPDPVKARQEWGKLRAQLEQLPRICRGIDAARAIDPEFRTRVDMQTRREWHLRARFTQQWRGSLLSLERFPQGGGPAALRSSTAAQSGSAHGAPVLTGHA